MSGLYGPRFYVFSEIPYRGGRRIFYVADQDGAKGFDEKVISAHSSMCAAENEANRLNTEQQRAPSKSQAKRIAAQKGESATAKKHDGPCWRNSHSDCGC